jgi:hypothetical protein
MARAITGHAWGCHMPLNYLWIAAVVGLVVYALANGKASEAGRIVFWTALLAIFLGR